MKTFYFGGTILTMDDPLYAEAVLAEDGKIQAVGSEEQLRKLAGDCEQVNLHGAVMLPGFIDSHSHFSQMATSQIQVSLEETCTVEQIRARIQAFIAQTNPKPGSWIHARDYDNNLMPNLANPTLEQLDRLAPGYPLVIYHKSGHMGLINSTGLQALKITPATPSPEGGKIEVCDGKLTGYLEENAFITYLKKIPMPTPDQMLGAFVKAQQRYASYGITTVQEGMVIQEMLPLYQLLLSSHQLKLDLVVYPAVDSYDAVFEQVGNLAPDQHLRVGGIKIFLDGSPQGRTAWMRTPYKEGEDNYCGYGTMTDEMVFAAMSKASDRHTQILCHCNGDAAAEQFLRCLEQIEQTNPELKTLRPVVIHGQLLGIDQLPRVKALGAMISFFVAHVYHWGDVHIRNFGRSRAEQISPAHSALEQKIVFTFHQDAPVIQPDMLETVWCAVNRMTRNGVHLGESEELSVLDALKAITCNAAYQYFEEQEKGSITAGKRADFVVLDQDPLKVPKAKLREIKVLKTYKDGVCIFSQENCS